jgi:hypothetical protein
MDRSTFENLAAEYFGPKARKWALGPTRDRLALTRLGARCFLAWLARRRDPGDIDGDIPKMVAKESFWTGLEDRVEHSMRQSADLCWLSDADRFSAEVIGGKRPLDVLSDPEVDITPLFRYVMASAIGLYAVAEVFEDRAIRQLLENPMHYEASGSYSVWFPYTREELPEH